MYWLPSIRQWSTMKSKSLRFLLVPVRATTPKSSHVAPKFEALLLSLSEQYAPVITNPSSKEFLAPRTSIGELSVTDDWLPISPERTVRYSSQLRSDRDSSNPAKPP